MQDVKGIVGVLYTASDWLMKMAAVNILWFLLSLPLFTAFMIFNMAHAAGVLLFSAAVLLFMPLLFFPATVAVFASVRDWLLDQDSTSSVKTYLNHLKANYKDSMKMGVLMAAVWLAWYLGYFYLRSGSSTLDLLFLITGLALFVYTVNLVSVSVHYRMSGKERLANAFFVSAGSPLLSLFIAASSGVLLWISLVKLVLLLPLLICSLSAVLSFSAFYHFTLRIKNKRGAEISG